MENVLLLLVVVLLLLVILLMIAALYFGWHFLKKKEQQGLDAFKHFHPEAQERLRQAQAKSAQLEANCVLHEKEPSVGACVICDQYFCKACLKPQGSLLFCREHLGAYLNASWSETYKIKATPAHPEAGVALIEWKKELWRSEAIPLYAQTHYKINLEGDEIESWLVIFAREIEAEMIKERIEALALPSAETKIN